MSASPTISPLDDCSFGATVTGIDLRALDDDEFAGIYRAWLHHGLLIFPGQHLDRADQNTFAARFGDLEFPAAPLSNVRRDGTLRPDDGSDDMMQVLRGNMDWHQDSTYMPVQAKGAVFAAEVVPSEGGETGFADTAAAHDVLGRDEQDRLAGLRAKHSLYHSQATVGHDGSVDPEHYSGYGFHDGPVSERRLANVHPETGRAVLAIGRHAYDVEGLSGPESVELLSRLVAITDHPTRTYYHRWVTGDVVVWDNRRLLHRATPWPFDQPRVMWHARIAGDRTSDRSLPAR